LRIADGVTVTDDLVANVAWLVDILYQQVTVWGLDLQQPIGALVQIYNPILRVTVAPADSIVWVDQLPADTELPEPIPTPYA
jgi:hypothetical protein